MPKIKKLKRKKASHGRLVLQVGASEEEEEEDKR
jgi:hypothetical protein